MGTLPRPFAYVYRRPPDREDLYQGMLLHESDDVLVHAQTVTPAEPIVIGGTLALTAGSEIVWFLFKDRPFDVGRFSLPDGTFSGTYVDIIEPVGWEGADAGTLQPITDLYLDLWIEPDGRQLILDEDELRAARAQNHITETQVRDAESALDMVLTELKAGRFPPAIVTGWGKDKRGIISVATKEQ